MNWVLPGLTIGLFALVCARLSWYAGVRYGQRLERDALRDRVDHANEAIGRAEVATRAALAAGDRYRRALRAVEPFRD